jgi:SAM-dependent methyltransferase
MEKNINFDKDYFESGTVNSLSKDGISYFDRQKEDCKQVANRIEMFLKGDKTKTILEIGCAYGQSITELKNRGYIAYGSDISEYAIKEGKSRLNNPDLMSGDIQSKDFAEQVISKFGKPDFDFVFSCITLEHMLPYNVKQVIKNLYKLTAKGGINYHAIDLNKGDDKTHYSIFTRRKWIELFCAEGLEYIEVPNEWIKLNWFLFKK